jgi:two-component system, chemotaxis family, protein-glutamate methylesterase/glutaminase
MAKIRVLIVDDAVMMRRLISTVLEGDPGIEVVGVAANGRIAQQKIPQVNPDVITMDVEMPDMNGIETVREIRKTYPRLPIIMFSSLTSRGAASTLDAIAAGATDYVAKPAAVGSLDEGIERLRRDMIPKIKAHGLPPVFTARKLGLNGRGTCTKASTDTYFTRRPPGQVDVVCIGTSTGGPNALAELFQRIPANFPVPIVIVQHMPPLFTEMLATRLNSLKSVRFHEGRPGQAVEPGNAYIAPGGKHMIVQQSASGITLETNEEPPENSCRPAVDVLFRSVVATWHGAALGVIMTGMGQDGLRGCEYLSEAGAQILAQDEESSVVWGMPGYVAQANLADKILPLNQLAAEINRRVLHGQPALAKA